MSDYTIDVRWRDDPKEYRRQWAAKNRSKDPEKYNAYRRDYYARNKKKMQKKARDWAKANPDKVRAYPSQSWEAIIQRSYGLTPERYQEILASQGGGCAICGGPPNAPGRVKRYAVDHDHACCPTQKKCCGKCVRGLLCTGCNVRLGVLENSEFVAMAEEYLSR